MSQRQLKLTLEFHYGDEKPFVICVRDRGPNFLGAYSFKTLSEAVAAFQVAWNVFDSVLSYLDKQEKSEVPS